MTTCRSQNLRNDFKYPLCYFSDSFHFWQKRKEGKKFDSIVGLVWRINHCPDIKRSVCIVRHYNPCTLIYPQSNDHPSPPGIPFSSFILFSYLSPLRGEDNLELHRRLRLSGRQSEMKGRSQRTRTYQGNNLTNGTVLPVEIYDRADAHTRAFFFLPSFFSFFSYAILSASFGARGRSFLLSVLDSNFFGSYRLILASVDRRGRCCLELPFVPPNLSISSVRLESYVCRAINFNWYSFVKLKKESRILPREIYTFCTRAEYLIFRKCHVTITSFHFTIVL